MQGLKLFLHAVRQLYGNLSDVIRPSALPFGLLVVATMLFGAGLPLDQSAAEAMMRSGEFPVAAFLDYVLIATVSTLWFAVSWHRYVLLQEAARIVPPFRGDRMLAYFGRSVQAIVVIILGALVLGIVAALFIIPFVQSGGSLLAATAVPLLVGIPITLLAYRISPLLPAAALGQPSGLSSAWAATKGANGQLLTCAVLWVVLFATGNFIIERLAETQPGPGLIAMTFWQWITTLIGVSILTTIYGHSVEKRPLV